MGWRRVPRQVLALLMAGALSAGTAAATARSGREAGPTPPRLSFTDGEVSFWRPGAEDWAPAKVNTPLAEGDSLYTGSGANLEVQVGPRAFIRAGDDTELGLESLDQGLAQFKVTSGHVAVDARSLPRGQAVELDTPNAAFTIDKPGYYRVDVDENRTTFVTRRGGEASVIPANGEAADVATDQQVVVTGTDAPELATSAASDPDEWDRWNLDRTGALAESSPSARHVPADVAGSDDLDRYGRWRESPRYGDVWVPNEAPEGWAPYSTGRWIWDPYYGWTWVDDAPWGWAPYHYGRWVFVDGYWGWAPGPVIVAPAYAPALVAFFGPSVSVSIGFPFVSWVALGFGEPCIPWWGPVGFVGSAWWGGWGGPRIVNNVVIQRNTYVNVRNVTVYKNVNVHNAVVAVHRDRFGRGRIEHARLTAADVHHLRPIHGQLGVKPTRASLVPQEGRGRRAPDSVHTRPVVTTRPPRDPSQRLERAGLNPGPHAAAPPARVVQPPRQRAVGGAPAGPRHAAGGQAREGLGGRNATAPPPPRPHAPRGGPSMAERRAPSPPSGAPGREPRAARPREGRPSAPPTARGEGRQPTYHGPRERPRTPSERPEPRRAAPARPPGGSPSGGSPPPREVRRAPASPAPGRGAPRVERPHAAPRGRPAPGETSRAPGRSPAPGQARSHRPRRV